MNLLYLKAFKYISYSKNKFPKLSGKKKNEQERNSWNFLGQLQSLVLEEVQPTFLHHEQVGDLSAPGAEGTSLLCRS
jgi:hypothetical protein